MSSPRQRQALGEALQKLRQRLPKDSDLRYRIHEDYLWLEILYIPPAARGQGSTVLAQVLLAANKAQLPVSLVADPTDEPGDPSAKELARWYARFGFKPLAVTEDGVAMERPVGTEATAEAIMRQARQNRLGEWSLDRWQQYLDEERGLVSRRLPHLAP